MKREPLTYIIKTNHDEQLTVLTDLFELTGPEWIFYLNGREILRFSCSMLSQLFVAEEDYERNVK